MPDSVKMDVKIKQFISYIESTRGVKVIMF
jgi:hypothetical protein